MNVSEDKESTFWKVRSTCGGGGGRTTRYGRADNSFLRKWQLIRDLKDSERWLVIFAKRNRGFKYTEVGGSRTGSEKENNSVESEKQQRKLSWQLMLLIEMRVKISRCLSDSNIDWRIVNREVIVFTFLIAHSHLNLSGLRRVRMDMRNQLRRLLRDNGGLSEDGERETYPRDIWR